MKKKQKHKIENRRHPRFILMLPLEINTKDFSIQTKTKNISCSGIYCEIDRFIPKDTEIDVNMRISLVVDDHKLKRTIACKARVVHIDPPKPESDLSYNIGLEFVVLEKPDKDLLLKYIKRKNTKEAGELKKIYLQLKEMAARLIEVEECHPTAEHFRRVIDKAVEELDEVAHILDYEINELKHLE